MKMLLVILCIAATQAPVHARVGEISRESAAIQEFREEIRHLFEVQNQRLAALEESIKQQTPYNEVVDPVAFTAYATSQLGYDSGETLIFDGVVTNLGEHYNATVSEFTCPYHGIYMFSTSVQSQVAERTFGAIYRDNHLLVNTLGDDLRDYTQYYAQGATGGVVECDVGQVVCVKAYVSSRLYGTTDRLSSFSGFLLHAYTSS